ncbi:hypothetical protein SCP_0312930 [Sparassis crispa]|uniref:Mitochondrial intermembrane space import and assembly protein 40 n=1 Tax=Sparassis crispa TaxID=139825 RepID=A0A401GH81_9APHY|nr:hypothetical protein SCP_0312930 [Sparassis crispa]GBE81564.1 hypothetical protein SCP_0312930 [Sparassis crispa]
MLRTVSKISFHRSLHNSASRPANVIRPGRVGAVLGASAVVSTYIAWRTLHKDSIALDSAASPPKQVPLTPKASVSPDALTHFPSTATQHEPSLHPPHIHDVPTEDTSADTPDASEGAEEASSGGAFNPETGEINWDCPCLGGMAHGPCGLQFREAFSCFVFSEKEPKGIECIERFKAMQDCFREHPDVYGEDIMDDDDDDEDLATPSADSPEGPQTVQTTSEPSSLPEMQSPPRKSSRSQPATPS